MVNNIFMIEKHEIYAGKGGGQLKGLRQCFGNSKQAAPGAQVPGSSDCQALKGVNKRKRVEFYEKRSIGLCY